MILSTEFDVWSAHISSTNCPTYQHSRGWVYTVVRSSVDYLVSCAKWWWTSTPCCTLTRFVIHVAEAKSSYRLIHISIHSTWPVAELSTENGPPAKIINHLKNVPPAKIIHHFVSVKIGPIPIQHWRLILPRFLITSLDYWRSEISMQRQVS